MVDEANVGDGAIEVGNDTPVSTSQHGPKCAACGQVRKILNHNLVCLICEAEATGGVRKEVQQAAPYAGDVQVPAVPMTGTIGRKDDQGKPDYTLLPWAALTEVVRVLEHGERRYGRDNWRHVKNARFRYVKAAFRHLVDYMLVGPIDKDSGCHHLAHVVCCCLFVIESFGHTSYVIEASDKKESE